MYYFLDVVFGLMFVSGAIYYWLSSRPFRWEQELVTAAENR